MYTLRNLKDVDRIKGAVDAGAGRAVVVGAGFIGVDLVENFLRRGMRVDVVELKDQVIPKDPVNMAGFVASNVMDGQERQIHVEDWEAGRPAGATLIDVRTPQEFAAGAIPGAVNLPVDELRDRLGEVPRDRPIVVQCQAGMRGYMAGLVLRASGREAYNLGGGYKTYLLHHPTAKAYA